MRTKYSYLTDLELVRSVRYDHGDLVEELCERLEKLAKEAERMEKALGDADWEHAE